MTGAPLMGGPYAHDNSSVRRTMGLVLLALTPATAYGLYLFGWQAVFLFSLTIGSCLLFEALSLAIARKPVWPFVSDGSVVLTGWLLAVSLPPWAPWWIGLVGGLLAVIVGKQIFGGLGQNVFNPAMVARVALLISFPLEMTRYTAPQPMFSATDPGIAESLSLFFFGGLDFDAVSSASLLGHVKTELSRGVGLGESLGASYDPLSLSIGSVTGSMGETSALLIVLGGLFLIFKRIISWHIPVAMLGSLAFMAALFHLIDPVHYMGADVHLLSGAALLGAFFIATDPVTSPVTRKGQIVFGIGCGLLVYVIRTWGGYPEGVAFAVLLMNAMAPLIDRTMRPRVYGRTKKGVPLAVEDKP